MSRKKVSTTIYITPEQAERLKLLHERTKVPISVYIREGIDMMLKHYEHVLPGQMSLESAPSPSISQLPPPPAVPATPAPRARELVTMGETPKPAVTMGETPKPPAQPVATLRTGSTGAAQAGPTRSGDGGA